MIRMACNRGVGNLSRRTSGLLEHRSSFCILSSLSSADDATTSRKDEAIQSISVHDRHARLLNGSVLAAAGSFGVTSGRRNFTSTSSLASSANTDGMNDSSTQISYASLDSATTDTLTQLDDSGGSTASTLTSSTTEETVVQQIFDPYWLNPSDQVIQFVNLVHESTGTPYALSVVGITLAIRALMLPIFIKSQKNSSRMAHMKPEMDALKAKFDRMGAGSAHQNDTETNQKMAGEMNSLFARYDCHPIKAMMLPFIQLPVFMSFFFGLKKMPEFFEPELSSGGYLWFVDLTQSDSTYILPILSAGTFLAIIEVGKEQMQSSSPMGSNMVNLFRGLAVIMVPLTAYFPAILFCYWVPNNFISLMQSIMFKNKAIKQKLGIWEPPPPVPGAPAQKGFVEQLEDAMGKQRNKQKEMELAQERYKIVDALKEGTEKVKEVKINTNKVGKKGKKWRKKYPNRK